MSEDEQLPYFIQGHVNDHEVFGAGTCLTTAIAEYAQECRRAASHYAELADALLNEAVRAEAAATAADFPELVRDRREVKR